MFDRGKRNTVALAHNKLVLGKYFFGQNSWVWLGWAADTNETVASGGLDMISNAVCRFQFGFGGFFVCVKHYYYKYSSPLAGQAP